MVGLLVLIIVAGISFIISTFEVLNANENIVLTSKTGHKVVVQYGDMYSPDIVRMRENIAARLCIDMNQVNVKATTEEGI